MLTGLLLLGPQIRNRQLWGVALHPHEELLKGENGKGVITDMVCLHRCS